MIGELVFAVAMCSDYVPCLPTHREMSTAKQVYSLRGSPPGHHLTEYRQILSTAYLTVSVNGWANLTTG